MTHLKTKSTTFKVNTVNLAQSIHNQQDMTMLDHQWLSVKNGYIIFSTRKEGKIKAICNSLIFYYYYNYWHKRNINNTKIY